MMNWINGFEWMCYLLTFFLLADILRKRNLFEAKLFASGALAGFTLELLAVRTTGLYFYNPSFMLNIGTYPYQFPVFGGLMWGGLSVCALRLAQRTGVSPFMTALFAGFLIVSMDLFLDPAAIRLGGGFWTWACRDLNTEISHYMFMSVIWVNFLGYLFETPMIVWLALRDGKKKGNRSALSHIAAVILNAAGGVLFVGICSLLSLWLDSVTDEWFSCTAFLIVWTVILVSFIRVFFRKQDLKFSDPEILAVLFFTAMYLCCTAGLFSLGIFHEHPWFLILEIILYILTILSGCVHTQ